MRRNRFAALLSFVLVASFGAAWLACDGETLKAPKSDETNDDSDDDDKGGGVPGPRDATTLDARVDVPDASAGDDAGDAGDASDGD